MFNNSPEMPFCSSLKMIPSCQTLSKAVDMSKKSTPNLCPRKIHKPHE